MIYLPKEWVIHKEQTERIHALLSRMDRDVILSDDTTLDDALAELENMGEAIVAAKLRDGAIPLGA